MFRFFLFCAAVGIAGVFFLVPTEVSAQLVTCDGTSYNGGVECNFCTLAAMISGVINFIVVILILISVIWLAVTGVQMAYTAAGNGDALSLLKERLTNIVIGFFLIIASWTLIDTLIKLLVVNTAENQIVLSWRTFGTGVGELCGDQLEPEANHFEREGADTLETALADGTVNVIMDPDGPEGELTQGEAEALLTGRDISVVSSGDCTDRTNQKCTSLDGMNKTTLLRMRRFQEDFGQPITITGGTEDGHAVRGTCTHASGCKFDMRSEPKVDQYIYDNYEPLGGDRYKDPYGNIYYRHTNKGASGYHWDVSVTN